MQKKSFTLGLLGVVERIGNRLPHPFTIFLTLTALVVIVSGITHYFGVSVSYMGIDRKTLETLERTVETNSLLSADGFRYMLTSFTKNFIGFLPLGVVLVSMVGVSIAESTGYISALIKRAILATPKSLLTSMIVFMGVMSNIATDAGYVVLVPLGAIIFLNANRHPLAGLAAAFAGVSGGFCANLIITPLDPMLSQLSTQAAHMIDPTYHVTSLANYYFAVVSTFLIVIVGTLITEFLVEPSLGKYQGDNIHDRKDLETISLNEKRGLRYGNSVALLFIVMVLFLTIPESGWLRNQETGSLIEGSAFVIGIVPLIMLFFGLSGLAYGVGAGTIKSDKDIARAVEKSFASMGPFIALALVAGQFTAYFNYSNLGVVISVKGAEFLQTMGFVGIPLVISFILLVGVANLFMGSSTAKWAIMAPIFVPMFMNIGISPEFVQAMYRIGDSSTNMITPLMLYFGLIMALVGKYNKQSGLGTLVSLMLPYTVIFMTAWTLLAVIWFVLGIPLGPGAIPTMPNF